MFGFPPHLVLVVLFLGIPSIYFLLFHWNLFHHKALFLLLLWCLPCSMIWEYVALGYDLRYFPVGASWFPLWGIPIEEYIFFLLCPIVMVAVYSLYARRNDTFRKCIQIPDKVLLVGVIVCQMLWGMALRMYDILSYPTTIILFVGRPSLFFLLRKGSTLHMKALTYTIIRMVLFAAVWEYFAIKLGARQFYDQYLLLGRMPGGGTYDSLILFSSFVTIAVLGMYTSLLKITKNT